MSVTLLSQKYNLLLTSNVEYSKILNKSAKLMQQRLMVMDSKLYKSDLEVDESKLT